MNSRCLRYTVLMGVLAITFAAATVHAQAPASTAQAAQQPATQIQAQLDKMVHVKKVKVGDSVSARVVVSVKLPDGTEVPKGSHVLGKVTAIKQKPDSEGPSKLALLFDTVDIKGGKQVPIRMALVSVGPHPEQGSVDSAAANNPMSGQGRASSNMGSGSGADSEAGRALRSSLGNSKSATGESSMVPGTSYLPQVHITSYSVAEPGTILESQKEMIYLDSGDELLFLTQ